MQKTLPYLLILIFLLFSCNDDSITNGNNDENDQTDPVEKELIHFFYFNEDMPNNTPFETLNTVFSAGAGGFISYQSSLEGYPFDENHEYWRAASMERRNQPTSLNYRPEGNDGNGYDADDIRGLQVRNPFYQEDRENILTLNIPTIDYKAAEVSFAVLNEGGAERIIIEYITESDDESWTTEGLEQFEFNLGVNYQRITLDFSEIEAVNNNLYFRVRIRFADADGTITPRDTDEDNSRVTFNNISVDAAPID